MTDGEKREALVREGLYGFWAALTFAGPLSFAILYRHPMLIAIAALLIPIHIACIPMWRKKQRKFLASTAWARQQGNEM